MPFANAKLFNFPDGNSPATSPVSLERASAQNDNEQEPIGQRVTGRQIINTKKANMKTSKLIRTTAALVTTALLTQIPLSARALDAWQRVDNYQLAPGLSASGGDVGTDPAGHIYIVGSTTPKVEGNRTAMVRASSDQGANWTNLSEYSEPGWEYAHFLGFASDGLGGLYVGGQLYNQVGQNGWNESSWVVRECHDLSVGWTNTEIFRPTDYSACLALKVAPWGDMYAAGLTTALAEYQGSVYWASPSWVVRKRPAGGSGFTTVDTVPTSAGITWADGIGFFGNAGVIVVGQLRGMYYSFWTVRRSTDNGATWATADYLGTADGWTGWLGGVAEEVAVDGQGTIYVVGAGTYQGSKNRNATPVNLWLVRCSTNSGVTWTTVDSFSYGSGTTPHATGVTVDHSGNLFVSGYVTTAQGDRWLVRKSTLTTTYVKQGKTLVPVSTVSWATSDDYQLSPGQSATGADVACDASGSIYVTGHAADATGVDHWVTRKLATP
jgi:hypothetical protein